ncbi:Os07g0510600 [Oryza sativa Japonica Group]|uniref:Os07g0510600 protein n=1 Tax=Oryza sativa subsp. japonica TaxID=39947 RepID=Q6Z4B6_ORYSJ|nr:unknown protein [Oryza sativa Japonica Group]BAF21670.1 Os07g0510600 [Oryza sativa Japonica Group]|eukprot:NP_001059756.1 Os07g0510600 [Oryza sativa Japonica Group]
MEFHPQCVTNPPTAAWARMSFCGARVGHTSPLPLVLSKNPSGRSSSSMASVGTRCPGRLSLGGPRSTHRKRCSLRSSAAAISRTLGGGRRPLLPKQTSSTDAGGCASSHRTHSCGCSGGGVSAITGPIAYTVGAGTPRVHRPSAMASMTLCSSSAAVLTMKPVAFM